MAVGNVSSPKASGIGGDKGACRVKALDRDDPREIGGYRILRVLGAGGMGRVYLARSPGGRTVAVKVIRPELADDQGFRHLFRREVAAARRVGGAWTAPVVDADTESTRPFLVTGYVAGPSVYEAVDRHGPLPEESVRVLGTGLAEALVTIHGTGLIHRDLKPTNVLLSLDGPRVIDFGISRALDASVHTRTGATVGSPGFMSPEQVDGRDVGPATDVFSLASVLVFAATAEGPFGSGSGQALMFRIVAKRPELGAVPPALRELISACLAKYAGNRPTPQEILAHLAPEGGTAALVAPGWLPAPLTTDLSRRAIALLEIDELAPQSDDAAGGGTGVDTAPARQGPPPLPSRPPAFAPTEPPSQPYSRYAPPPPPSYDPRVANAAAAVAAPAAPPAPPGTADPPDPPDGPPEAFGPPPAGTRRGRPLEAFGPLPAGTRRGTPWLYLSAVAAAVAIISGSALVARSGAEDADGAGPTAPATTPGAATTPTTPSPSPPSPSTTPPSGAPAPSGGRIPDHYVGTWSGTITSKAGTSTELTVTLHQADGQGFVASTRGRPLGLGVDGACVGDSRLVSASGPSLVLQDVPNNKPQPTLPFGLPACTSGQQIKLSLDSPTDADMACEMLGGQGGNPTGTLRRTT